MTHIFDLVQFYNSCLNKVSKITRIGTCLKSAKSKKQNFVHSIKMSNSLEDLGLTLEDLKAVAEVRGIKNYESMSKDEPLSLITTSKKRKKANKAKKRWKTKNKFF